VDLVNRSGGLKGFGNPPRGDFNSWREFGARDVSNSWIGFGDHGCEVFNSFIEFGDHSREHSSILTGYDGSLTGSSSSRTLSDRHGNREDRADGSENSEDSKGAHIWISFGSLGSDYQMNVMNFRLKSEPKMSGYTLEERVAES
jgi:hypothetical protein